MYFVKAVVVFFVFFFGMGLAGQGIIGKQLQPFQPFFRMPIDPEHPGVEHPPERHRLRLVLIGPGLMMTAVKLGILIL
jgi:hypothetical protein